VLGKSIYVGLSTRSNPAAIDQLNDLLQDMDITVSGVRTDGCLHLKSAVTRVDEKTLLINPNWVDANHFAAFDRMEADPSEPFAANCLPVGDSIIFPLAFPKTRAKLEARAINW